MPEEFLLLRDEPNWTEGVEETHEYLTDVLTPYNSQEQRVRLRASPRLNLKYRLLFPDVRDAIRFENELWALKAKRVQAPLWQDATPLLAAAVPPTTELECDTTTRRFFAGSLALLWRDPADYELVTIESVAPGVLTLTGAVAGRPTITAEVAPHEMTDNSTPSPYVASASSFFSGHGAFRAFEGGLGTDQYWIGTGGGADWLKLDLGSGNAKKLYSYGIQANTIPEPDRAPKDWTMEGSNNGADWTVIDTQTDQTAWGSGELRTFLLGSPPASYRYFRLNITANNGDATYIAVGELYLSVTNEWPADGRTYVIPVFPGRLEDAPEVRRPTTRVAETDINILTEAVPIPEAAWSDVHGDFDVLPIEPDRSGDLTVVWERSLHHLDPQTGVERAWDRAGMPLTGRRDSRFILDGRAEIAGMLDFLSRRAGRLNPFYMPSWTQDFVMNQDMPAGAMMLAVENTGYVERLFDDCARRQLALFARDPAAASGYTPYFREITQVATDESGVQYLMEIAPLAHDLSKSTGLVSFLHFVRLDADDATLLWHTTKHAELVLGTRELPVADCPPATIIDIPIPPPPPNLRRALIGPRACSGSDGSCGGASASCSAAGGAPGSGIADADHGTPTGPYPVMSWGNFILPDWLSPSQVRWVRFVIAWSYKPAAKMLVGVANYRIGNASHWIQDSISLEETAVRVSPPIDGDGFSFGTVTAEGEIHWTLDDPPGDCFPCGSGGPACHADLAIAGVCMVLDYEP